MTLLKKKRKSTSTLPDQRPDELVEQTHLLEPSSPSAKTGAPTTPKKGSALSTGSSPLRTRLSSISPSPSHLKSVVTKKVKRQIQRLDDALQNVTGRPRGHSAAPPVAPEERGKSRGWSSRRASEGFALSFPSFSSSHQSSVDVVHFPSRSSSPRSSTTSRKRTSSPPRDDHYQAAEDRARYRTVSCPGVPLRAPLHKRIASFRTESTLGSSLMALSEEQAGKGHELPVIPVVYVEPEVPDPFFVDDEGDEEEGESQLSSVASDGRQTASPAAADSVRLSVSPSLGSPAVLSSKPLPSPFLSPNLNKHVPPPPLSDLDEDESEDEAPEISLPGLIVPTMFLPIPNNDPLTTLLNKYIYPPEKRPTRDVTGDWQQSDFHTLVMTNSWRALARMARDRIVEADPVDVNLILGLWHLRLSCLARLRLFNQTAAECTNLFTVLNAIEPLESREQLFEQVLPFELEVMQTRLKYWGGDPMGYLDALSTLLNKCKVKSRRAVDDESTAAMWKERGARVILIIASQLVQMKEYTASARLLEPLCQQKDASNPALRSAVARIYLQVGNLQMAANHFERVAQDPAADERQKQMNAAVLASARGEWEDAVQVLRGMIERDNEDYVAVNNLSVALLSQGNLKEGIAVLESALKASPSSVVVAEPFLFNLSTLYELRSMAGFEKKRQLLVEVGKWGGDGLKTTCLKLPAN